MDAIVPMNLVEAKRLVKTNVTRVVNNQDVVVDDDGMLYLYNERLDHYEGFASLEEIFDSAVHHRTFQQCI